jgi:FkbM family methyltransferase
MKKLKLWFASLPPLLALRYFLFLMAKKALRLDDMFYYFSQTGEDTIIRNVLPEFNGYYVDVGCNEPITISNTFRLYLEGWTGLNIDANERLIQKFRKIRKRDKSITAAVSDEEKEVTLYLSDNPAVSTIDSGELKHLKKFWDYPEQVTVKTRTLNSILDEHLPTGQKIDLMTIDVEGHDLNVLKSVDLNKYRPKLIVIEMHRFTFEDFEQNPVYQHLRRHGYKFAAYAVMNGYFTDEKIEN